MTVLLILTDVDCLAPLSTWYSSANMIATNALSFHRQSLINMTKGEAVQGGGGQGDFVLFQVGSNINNYVSFKI